MVVMIQISEATSEDAAPHHLPFVPKKSMDLEEESYDNAMGGEMMRWVESHGGWRCDASPLRPSPLQHGRCERRRRLRGILHCRRSLLQWLRQQQR
jgi:hypothetical protein